MNSVNAVITCIRLNQAAVIAYISHCSFSLLAGSGTEIRSVFMNVFLCVNIYTRNFDIRKDLLVGISVIP